VQSRVAAVIPERRGTFAARSNQELPMTSLSSTLRACLALPLAAGLTGQQLLRTDAGILAGESFGAAIVAVGDVDGDGVSDYAVGVPETSVPAFPDIGEARVLSGANGQILRSCIGPRAGARFGRSLAALGDVDGDGVPDLAIGAPDDAGGTGFVSVRSLGTGAELCSFTGQPQSRLGASLAAYGASPRFLAIGAPGVDFPTSLGVVVRRLPDGGVRPGFAFHPLLAARLGASMATLGDADGDGLDDLAVLMDSPVGGVCALILAAQRDGTLTFLTSRSPAIPHGTVACAVASAGDVDGDGQADFLLSHPEAAGPPLPRPASVFVYSRFGVLRTIGETGNGGGGFGRSIAGVGDLDGDGRAEIAIGAPLANGARGRVRIVDVMMGEDRFVIDGLPGDAAGTSLAALGDLDGDNLPEVAIGRPFADDAQPDAGAVDLRSSWLGGSYRVFGAACPGSNGLPTVSGLGTPQLGGSIQFRSRSLPPFRPSLVIQGVSDTIYGVIPLPLDLSGFGAPGCWLHVSAESAGYTTTNSNGTAASAPLAIPPLLALVGHRVYCQFAAFETNGGRVFTPGIEARIGR
jgi:hypothetical protein